MRSIRFTITVSTVLIILTSTMAVLGASYLIGHNETDQNSVRMMNLINEDREKTLEKYFGSIEQSAEIMANVAIEDLDSVFLAEYGAVRTGTEISEQTPEQKNALDEYLRAYCARIQGLFSGVADNTQGIVSYFHCINPELSSSERGFYYKKIGKTGLIEQPPLDVVNLEPEEHLGTTWYQAAVSMGRPGWVGPYVCENQWVYSYFVPIYKAGLFIGLIGMDISCDTLVDQLRDVRIYNTGYLCLLDTKGRVIYHPDLPIGSSKDELQYELDEQLMKRENSGNVLIRYTADNVNRQVSYSTLSNGLTLFCVVPTDEINAPWIRLVRDIAMIAILIIGVFAVLVSFLMGAIMYPLKQLTDASQRLADADYTVDLNYEGRDEIGALTGAFKRMRDQIRQYIENLNHQILYDRMTDLPNMRHFFTLALQEKEKMQAEGLNPVMVYIDIIGIRHYNRQYGFKTGDKMIMNLAEILARHFGAQRACRFGGDHFTAVTDETRIDAILKAVLKDCETAIDGKPMSIRVGVYPGRLEEVDVSTACDRAKYACDLKRGELSSVIAYYDETMRKQGEMNVHIIQNLDRALKEGWIKVYYQPIVRAADGKVCDEEALARWIDPEFGFLSPGYFIPALEEAKLIYKLDLYVVEQVLKKMKEQERLGMYLVPQSINLSRMDFESCDIVEEICRRVDEAGVDHSMITIEITESIIGSDFEFMKEQIARFRKLGFPVWMDDFGSGYSSLDGLNQIPFDLIKFNMSFMERFDEGDEGKIILTELVNMAMSLKIETVCEGVEKAEQVEFLREIGCTRIQGFYYGRPVSFEEIVASKGKEGALEYENPAEAGYYASIGRINLYDFSALSSETDSSLAHYFNTLPMCIIEVNGTRLWYSRCNQSYRDFLKRTMNVDYSTEEIDLMDPDAESGTLFLRGVMQCVRDGKRAIIDENVGLDTIVHTMIRRIAVNPVTNITAIAVAVLAVSTETADGADSGQRAENSEDTPRYMAHGLSTTAELKDTIISLLDNMPCLTFTKLAKTGVYIACNQAFAEYAHKTGPAGVIGLTDSQIFDEKTASHFIEDDKKALSMNEPYVFIEDVLDAAGNRRCFQTTKLKYYNFNSQLCILGMCQDVTDIVRVRRENSDGKM